ncbi:MAG: DUF3990 domain-containing protein [Ruminococcaceae bacterium]|nr:DUF3990 domain-containing protein [Oscillospiraceae bacterium]
MKLYHTSNTEICFPDVNYGRKNADFGGGFYLTDNLEFAGKWSSTRKPVVNSYTLDLTGLNVKRFRRDKEWFEYISSNRAGLKDKFAEADVIIGPIANDTLYDTYGIIISSLLTGDEALRLLKVGNQFTQITLKTEKAVSQLEWNGSRQLKKEEIDLSKTNVKTEEAEFQGAFKNALKELENYETIKDILSL